MVPTGSTDETTIVAIATPQGRGGIGVVRLSGAASLAIAHKLVKLTNHVTVARSAHYGLLVDEQGRRVDDALVTYFPSPHSYTGEDVVEIATHGSPVVLDWLVREAVKHGAQPARPGEFTERAFLCGRMDLTAAEAVRDLIDAQTLHQARQAAEQMGGSIANVVRPIKQQLVELIATLEAGIDFAEDDIDTLPAAAVSHRISLLLPPLQALLASFAHGRILRDGLRLAIIGKPNAGKSSLFNRLVERERAIVTAAPGTTRDVISVSISIGGIPIELMDTAGLRETSDEAERMGVARSHEAIAEADAILLVVDATQPPTEDSARGPAAVTDETLLAALQNRPVIVAYNKADLLSSGTADPHLNTPVSTAVAHLRTSATTGEGVPQLREALLTVAQGGAHAAGGATLTNLRQQAAVQQAVNSARRALSAATSYTPHEMILLDLYESLRALDELTGQTTPDDVLNLIFSSFCIGK